MQLNDLTNKDRIYTVNYSDTVTLKLRHVSREELRDMLKQATVTRFVNHQKISDYDAIKSDCLLGRAAIKGWSGIMLGEEEAPCTPENIDTVMTCHNNFARFINAICDDIDALVREEQEALRKN